MGGPRRAFGRTATGRGAHSSKAEAIRAALNSFAQIQNAKQNGYRVVAVPDEVLKRIGVAIEVS